MDYAANFWGSHAEHCQKKLLKPALRLLCDQQLAAHAFKSATHLYQEWPFLHSERTVSTRVTGLHLVAALGLETLCQELLKFVDTSPNLHADARDDGRRTALMWQRTTGMGTLSNCCLIAKDVAPGKVCGRGDSALHYAARRGRTPVVELLQKWRAKSTSVQNPDFHASENLFGETAIVQAALEGHADTVKVLSPFGLSPLDYEVMFGLWPVHVAAQRRSVAVVKLLIEDYRVNQDRLDPKGHSPFMVAVDWGNEEVVRYFLQPGRLQLDPEKYRSQLIGAAHIAAANWKRLSILQLIAKEVGFVLNSVDGNGVTLLKAAIDANNIAAAIFISAHMTGDG